MHQFGGQWTEEKLERVRKYLAAYTTIFNAPKAKRLVSIYVDAFAGTGSRSRSKKPHDPGFLLDELEDDPDRQAFRKGSARIALEVEPAFKRYLFIEQNPSYVKELQRLKVEFTNKADRIEIVEADANSYLKTWCQQTDWRISRAVVFLDPYGMQVDWSLIDILAKTKSVDLWILFPLGSVNRLLTRNEEPPPAWSNTLTQFFGTGDWKRTFYRRERHAGLFGEEERVAKDADFDAIGAFFVHRLKTVFPTVAPKPLVLRNSKNSPLYLLCFACANPKPSVAEAALNIADHILSR